MFEKTFMHETERLKHFNNYSKNEVSVFPQQVNWN